MKRILKHAPREKRPKMWRSLGELENDPVFEGLLTKEFPEGASVNQDGVSRRDFMRLMGASAALVGISLAGCRRPEALLVPFKNNNEWTIPGKFLYYSTAMPTRFGVMPMIASTVDGRPTKLEGNPLHPESNGGTNGFAQASILDLYDPYRAKKFTHKGQGATEAEFTAALAELRKAHQKDGGAGLAFLVDRTHSPTRDRLREEILKQFPSAMWTEYEPLGGANARGATEASFGEGARAIPHFERADIILSLDGDFLNCNEMGVGYARGFYPRRNPDQTGAPVNRLYVVESAYTLTGGMADHRLRAKASAIPAIAVAFAKQIAAKTNHAGLTSLVGAYPSPEGEVDAKWVEECANDLLTAKSRSLVLTRPQQSAALLTLVHGINEALGNNGTVIETAAVPVSKNQTTIEQLTDVLKAGRISTLFIFGGNPVYNAPADLDFASLLDSVPNSVRLGFFEDETSQHSKWNVPATHYLESWGDGRSFEGIYSIIQPMILPLYSGLSDLDILAQFIGLSKTEGPEHVQDTFRQLFSGGDFSASWNEALRKGFVATSAYPVKTPAFNAATASAIVSKAVPLIASGIELVFTQSPSVDDGRYANNSWLQETPDFVTKITWDNAALISPATAKKLGVKTDEDDQLSPYLEISSNGKTVKIPAYIAPGQADDSISVALGYGRKNVSHLMENVGFDIYPLRRSDAMRVLPNVEVKNVGGEYHFAVQQIHANMEGRDHAREGTLERFKSKPAFAKTMGMDGEPLPPNISLYTNPPLTAPEQWAMTVDLNTCTGCNACIVACQAENNVPVVGKDQVIKGRHMGWIRIDRYFGGDKNDPEMIAQAIMCQHCENAPCETVCPVNATVHSEEGLNLMAYNRCIGTKYCANNCPWKVRRFNFFDYNQRPLDELYFGPVVKKGMADSLQMSKNPNVTVRMRGVMEKCTFCIQRIEEAKISHLVAAGASSRNAKPMEEFKSACQQACSSDSIVFGNEKNPNSRVARLRNNERSYVTLKYLNTRPRVSYLARIKNPNPRMPEAERVGHINTEEEHEEKGHGETGKAHEATNAPVMNLNGGALKA
ncbi:MAG: TAT-variant-translocated molybdopterin oxidoreductase [Chthoniobacterales bacterium]